MRKLLACFLSFLLVAPVWAADRDPLVLVKRSYLELLTQADEAKLTEAEAEPARKALGAEHDLAVKQLDSQIDATKSAIKELRVRQDGLNRRADKLDAERPENGFLEKVVWQMRSDALAAERKALHCAIFEAQRHLLELGLRKHSADVLLDNQNAKIDLLVNWPADSKAIQETKSSGRARLRRHGDADDIGFRKGFDGQEKDVSWGKREIEDAKRMGEIPPEVLPEAEKRLDKAKARFEEARRKKERMLFRFIYRPGDALPYATFEALRWYELEMAKHDLVLASQVTEYMQGLGSLMARSSDLKVPLNLYLLWDDDPNAFAVPGGYVFINTGLLYGRDEWQFRRAGKAEAFQADDEAEVAGVLAHELAHVTARHAARMRKHYTVMNLIYQGAIMAAIILTGGAMGIGLYYAIQYGLLGLGMVMSLELLGVSRACEREADQLGVQGAWRAGIDPTGFMRFFDKVASEFGYARNTSWFRTHPAFYDRIHDTYAELNYLPAKQYRKDSSEFQAAIEALKELRASRLERLNREGRDAPTLAEPVPDCEGKAVCR